MDLPAKAALRTQARQLLAALPSAKRAIASAQIRNRIEALPAWTSARTVAFYAAQASEPDLLGLLPGKVACFPCVFGDILEFRRCDSLELLKPSRWNLLEPDPEQCALAEPSDIDLFLIPGLAFTRTGGRLGRGGGLYDRFLARIHPRALKIGVCFQAQIVPVLPLETHDHEVDLLVTEEETIPCEK